MAKKLNDEKVEVKETALPSEQPPVEIKGEVLSITNKGDHEEVLLWITGKVKLGEIFKLVK